MPGPEPSDCNEEKCQPVAQGTKVTVRRHCGGCLEYTPKTAKKESGPSRQMSPYLNSGINRLALIVSCKNNVLIEETWKHRKDKETKNHLSFCINHD